jgi:homoserine kinase
MEVTFQVPASTSNFGPGFDCLGAALRLYNRVTVSRSAPAVPAHPMAAAAADAFFKRSGVSAFPFAWSIRGDVPRSRGLGSSVTLRLGLLAGLNALSGEPLNQDAIFEVCAALEGHPDNAAPALYGGFTVAGADPSAGVFRFAAPSRLGCVLWIPDFEIETQKARALLPDLIPRRAAVASSARACRITAAFAARDYERLRGAFADEAFHQPHRLPLLPCLPEVIAAGVAAGALGGFLSGSGSTILCLTLDAPERVAAAMLAAAPLPGARTVVTAIDNRGARRIARR